MSGVVAGFVRARGGALVLFVPLAAVACSSASSNPASSASADAGDSRDAAPDAALSSAGGAPATGGRTGAGGSTPSAGGAASGTGGAATPEGGVVPTDAGFDAEASAPACPGTGCGACCCDEIARCVDPQCGTEVACMQNCVTAAGQGLDPGVVADCKTQCGGASGLEQAAAAFWSCESGRCNSICLGL